MMDTVLNLGLNEETLHGPDRADRQRALRLGRLPPLHPDVRAHRHGRRRRDASTTRSRRPRRRAASTQDTDLDAAALRELVGRVPARSSSRTPGASSRPIRYEQLDLAIKAVFASWFGKRALDYRDYNKIAHDLGTAVNVVTMVFGNMGDDSGTGVAFTRDPNTGEKVLFGEYLTNAQGEDVVAGIRTPQPISQMRDELPEVYAEFERIGRAPRAALPATCRTSSSPSSAAGCTCSRRAPPSAPPRRPCGSPPTWSTRASSPSARRWRASSPRTSTSCCATSSTRPPRRSAKQHHRRA